MKTTKKDLKFYVYTWDWDKHKFTPQKGVRCGPYPLFALRRAILKLRDMGYEGHRDDPSTLVVREDMRSDDLLPKRRK